MLTAYLLLHPSTKTCALIDPAEPPPILQVLKSSAYSNYKLTHILTTHKHWDHAGGNLEMIKHYPDLIVTGGSNDSVPGATQEVKTGDNVQLNDNINVQCYEVPCHTKGHVLYHLPAQQILFTGDTIFLAGAGRFFEGNAQQMYHNIFNVIKKMDQKTHVFCGHEYSIGNLEFATWLEPSNSAITNKLSVCRSHRSTHLGTIPSTLGEESEWNPFFRVHEQSVVEKVKRLLPDDFDSMTPEQKGIAVMTIVRNLKNENAHQK